MHKFCIVIPTYNSIATLPAAIDSALAQDFGDYIVAVSDNCSSDGTREYLRGLAHSRLRVFLHDTCLAKTDNWNRAYLSAPPCCYYTTLHSDDILTPGCLSALNESIWRNPAGALFFGAFDLLSLDGITITRFRNWPMRYTSKGRRFDRIQFLGNCVGVVGATFPAALFKQINGFGGKYQFMQDVELWRRLAALGSVVYTPVKLGLYRAAPARPKAQLQYAEELADWYGNQMSTFNSWISRWIVRSIAIGSIEGIKEVAGAKDSRVELNWRRVVAAGRRPLYKAPVKHIQRLLKLIASWGI